MNFNAAIRYGLLGAIFGLLFPVLGTFIVCWQQFGAIDFAHLVMAQRLNALLWIIDTAPIFLGFFAYLAGAKQDYIKHINDSLAEKVREQTQDLREANGTLKREIEAREQREKQLVEAYEAAEAGRRAKDQFVSSISHEIRTPMNGVLGMTEVMLRTELSETQRESLQAIEYSARNLMVIINDLLDLAKANVNKLELEQISFDLRDVMRFVERSLRGEAARKRIHFEVKTPTDLPRSLRGDPVRLGQILMNLAGNAVKFTDQGSVTVEVEATARGKERHELLFRVTDTGIGVPADFKATIFDDFTQANSGIARKYGGTGLGLSITRKLVEMHGGKLQLDSVLGEGSCFAFRIQLDACEPVEATLADVAVSLTPLSAEEQAKSRVLLVEDNQVNQKVAGAFLKRLGLQWDLAENGLEALALLSVRPYDVVLMDIHMPELDGLETTRRIRASRDPVIRQTKIIAMTASVLKTEVTECYEVGVNDYVAKPFKPADFERKVIAILRGDRGENG